MRFFLIVFLFLIFIAACSRQAIEPMSSPASSQTPDYEATATKIIADATATAVGFLDAGCLPQASTMWHVHISLMASGENIDTSDSRAENQTYRENWLCDGQLALDHLEYEITLTYEGQPEEIDFVALINDILLWLADYPPNELPDIEPLVSIHFYQRGVSYEEMFENSFSWNFSYSEALAAYAAGLRGADLAEALGIYFP